MNREQDILRQILRIARAGRDFFAAARNDVADAEIRDAFTHIADVKQRLIAALEPWIDRSEAGTDHVSAAVSVEKIYVDLRSVFRTTALATSARGLSVGEEQLLRLVERAFEHTLSTALKETLKTFYPQLVICREAMSRLRARLAA